MLDQEICIKIGKLMRAADDLQLYYYKEHDKMNVKDVPSVLIGGQCLNMICNHVQKGIDFLKRKTYPFIQYAEAQSKKNNDNPKKVREAKGKKGNFKNHIEAILERVDKNTLIKPLTVTEKNSIRFSYFKEF